MSHLAELPTGYDERTTFMLAPGDHNLIIATHPKLPPLYLDEDAMQWRVLDRHIRDLA
jgi:hypothetical protein